MKATLIWSTMVVLGLDVTSSYAQNKKGQDEIFTGPKNGEGTQILLGIADAVIAEELFKSAYKTPETNDPRVGVLQSAEKDLKAARSLLTEADRADELRAAYVKVETAKKSVNAKDGVYETDDLRSFEDEVQEIREKKIVDAAEKAKRIESAEKAVSDARAVILKEGASIKGSKLNKLIKGVKVVGGTVFVLDLAGRIYIWNAADRDPTLMPVATYSLHHLGRWFSSESENSDIGFKSNADYRNQYNSGHQNSPKSNP